jgi:hypothetical protein
MADKIEGVVYPAPSPSFPHLGVLFMPDGTVDATPFKTFEDAQAFILGLGEALDRKAADRSS